MQFYTVHYKTPHNTITAVPVATGGEYTTIMDFVRDFAQHNPGYILHKIEEKDFK